EILAFVLGVVEDFLAFGFDVLARFFEAFVGFFVGLFACGFADLFGLALGLGDPLFSVFLRLFDYLLGFAFCALYPVKHLWSRHVVLWGLYHGLFGRSGYRFALGTPPEHASTVRRTRHTDRHRSDAVARARARCELSERRARIGVRGMSTTANEVSEERSRLGRHVAVAVR